MPNVNDTFFNGYYREIWKTIIPDELTAKEVDFVISYFSLQPGAKVLDLMCGYGRHAIALGRKGIAVTAVDNLKEYISEVNDTVKKEALPVRSLQQGVLEFIPDDTYDLAICMGNSLNFFDADDTTAIFSKVSSCLKPGGHLLINSWSIAEIVYKNFKGNAWSMIGDKKFLTESKVLFSPARIETESIIIAPDGGSEIKKGVDYIFSLNEIETMLTGSGLTLKEVYSIPGKKKFVLGEPRAYIVALKP
jgi:SAM-dependent methyltransferase